MSLRKTLAVVNEMQAAGVIGRYAIGGAVGATFYLELDILKRHKLLERWRRFEEQFPENEP